MNTPGFSGRGWLLPEADRAALLEQVPPAYSRVVAHHVTFAPEDQPTPEAEGGEVVGVADDGAGVQALVVRINGTTDRPDGSVYHVTWSLEPHRGAVESNHVIAERGWTPLPEPSPVRLERAG